MPYTRSKIIQLHTKNIRKPLKKMGQIIFIMLIGRLQVLLCISELYGVEPMFPEANFGCIVTRYMNACADADKVLR